MLSLCLGYGRKQWCSGFHGCGLGGVGAADRGGEAARQDSAEGAATDHRGDRLAASERGQVAQHSGRTRPLVAGGPTLHPLGQEGRVGGPARPCPAARRRARHDLHRWHHHPGSPQGGGRGKKGVDSTERDEREALGRSRGGYGTKACVIADGRGRAIAFILAPGQAHELPHAVPLLERLPGVPKWGVADRGLSSHAFREHIWSLGARPAIPSKQNEAPVACPDWIYVNRHRVENLWARLKEWRAIATRYEKTASSFMGVLCLAAALDWLKP